MWNWKGVDLYMQEKIKVKQSAEVESQFRAELLKIKLDKNTLSSQVKSLTVKIAMLRRKSKVLNKRRKNLQQS
jgi:hypothetical protein